MIRGGFTCLDRICSMSKPSSGLTVASFIDKNCQFIIALEYLMIFPHDETHHVKTIQLQIH
jgi:hypothetical protein